MGELTPYLGVVPAALLACYMLAQRWLDRRAERIGAQRARYREAEERLLNAIEALRNEVRHQTPACCYRGHAVAVVLAHNELADAARPTHAFVPEFTLREAFDRMEAVNEVPF